MTIETHHENGDAQVSASGELDLHTQGQLRRALENLLNQPGQANIGIDLSEVKFVDSAGVRALHDIGKQMRKRGRKLILTGASPQVQRTISLLTVAGLLSL